MDELIAEDPPRIGPYRLIARLGAGGMGLVYLGRSEGGRTVAVKVVQAEFAGQPEFRRRFAREVAAARRVGGNWTAAVLDADPEAAIPWVATQYIPGPDLQTVVAKDFGPLPEHSVRILANRLALALRAIHEAGLIHRDLKPSNVLVTVDAPRVIDFGIARAMESLTGDSLYTRPGMLIGSPGFMSPEQVRGLDLTPASDVFCLGAVLVYASTGRLLFGAPDTGLNAHLFRIAEEEADLTGVPESLVDLVRACLDKAPDRRPTPEEVAARTATDHPGEWLPGAVLAQLGRHAAELLDFAPAQAPAEIPAPTPAPTPAQTPAHAPAQTPVEPLAARPDPRVASDNLYAHPLPAPPAYPPATATPLIPGQVFGPVDGSWVTTATPLSAQDPAPPHPRRWWGLAFLVLAQLMVLLQASAFNIAFPSIQADLGMRTQDLSSLGNAYGLAFGGFLLIGGHLADLAGRKRILTVGVVGLAVACGLGGAAANADMLLWARALQGVFGALLTASALSLVANAFTDPRERGRAFGVYATVIGSGSVLSLLAGGWFVETLSWRWSFFSGVLLAVIVLIGALTLVHDRPGSTGARPDPLGVILGSGALVALTYGLTGGQSEGWAVTPLVLLLIVGGALLFVAFMWWQSLTSNPVLAPDGNRIGAFLAVALSGIGLFTLFAALTFFLQFALRLSPFDTAVHLLPLVAANVIASTLISPHLLRRTAPRLLIVAGLLVTAVGLALLASLSLHSGYAPLVLPGIVLVGLGSGLAVPALFAVATDAAGPHAGGASAVISGAQHLGLSIGAALLSASIANQVRAARARSLPVAVAEELLKGHINTLWWACGSTLLAALLAAVLIGSRSARPGAMAHPDPSGVGLS
ncbi:MDR family MFS transporter [Streptomyces sp. NPDC006529]|uniref:MDR family MFS transporter n=1 Tax=Streptomyces sp. NPDC006529 TaxID=3157177 RepID=UPI0033A609E5